MVKLRNKNHILLCDLSISILSYSDAGNQDRVVIQELIKTVAQSQQIQSSTQREFKGTKDTSVPLYQFNHVLEQLSQQDKGLLSEMDA